MTTLQTWVIGLLMGLFGGGTIVYTVGVVPVMDAKQAAEDAYQRAVDAHQTQMDLLKGEYADYRRTQEKAASAATDAYRSGLADGRRAADTAVSDAQRLLRSAETRAAGYRSQAEACGPAGRILADRTEQLDRGIAEGRVVVEELRGFVNQRDREVTFLRSLILADRGLNTSE